MLEVYNEMMIFIPVYIMEDVKKLVAWKLSGGSCPGGTDLEALYRWVLKCRDDIKTFFTIVDFFNFLVNKNPPWIANHSFMYWHLITLEK